MSSPAEEWTNAYYKRRELLYKKLAEKLPQKIVIERDGLIESEISGMLSHIGGKLLSNIVKLSEKD